MNRNSNLYTITYAAVMVILVAIGLAFASQSLKGNQRKNENVDKMQQILRALKVDDAKATAITMYNEVITDAFLVDEAGNIVEGSNGTDEKSPAFTTELKDMSKTGHAPVFVANINGVTKYVLGLYGQGLWGPIWGYLSVDDDKSTVYGVDFSHASETPGLGAKITETFFRDQFVQKKIFSAGGTYTSVSVVKPGSHVPAGRDYVDGISGSTLTSNGVNSMLFDSLKKYEHFLTNKN
ncbi:NADH:ubiquinone reductase (Na(+)-transporting) subunit C [Porphyromonas sp.]|uniref:NADH:ubiquinone reductase (Na(+)-transporting) subunit C n=1 Tax=Porphyromonas sp. TaxID=1924944 RepID=UPI0026DB11C7|nr:NADH:ubiquinone reductase (Na(+)-transporting) subunit C [Porphyromonas sp.]MDO4695702.1 NADH:ubiquinone reductase (Na(+)-transporting) subunit C [Porphyromonas sp.]MDO4771830.1 NADH:ubiquinone reductase (Na(+)-transporting) subunit C [Porphyromonas sp.]